MKNVLVLIAALAACNTPTNTPAPTPAGGEAPSGPAIGALKDPGEKVLTVNGAPVGIEELKPLFKRMRVPENEINEFAWTSTGSHVAEKYALVTALYNDAIQQQIWNDPEIQRELAMAERQMLAAAMQDKLVKSAINEQAIKDWYERNKARFDKPEVKARHIRVADEALAKELLASLQKGEKKFEELAKIHSADKTTAERGGDLGWFQEQENPTFGKEAFAAEKGALIGPIQSSEGFHVVEILDKRDSTPLEEVRPLAEAEITRTETPKILEQYRQNMKIEWVKEPERAPVAPPHPMGGGMPGMSPDMGMPPGGPHGAGGAPDGAPAPSAPPAPPAPGGGAGR